MNNEKPLPGVAGDKFEVHYRQQLSALIDGELSTDEARFMLRRLQHDAELSGCHERWLLCGDVLRGQSCAPAPLDFAGRVAAAVAHEPPPERTGSPSRSPAHAPRRWLRWGGGTALAASVAALAMFMSREQLPDNLPPPADESAAVVATTPAPAPTPAPVPVQAPAMPADPDGTLGQVVAAAPAAALAAARRQEASARRTVAATRT
ncbi:RseA family anti-sigma factor, partial [Stenotrophomonas sp. MMGLT7]|uniref:sigma-E factor negative regulatory protein n=1 Tax=Stenotrophomonas sp. MMGLT7 TaxID=2901227 RepID=UPI0022B23DEF